MSELEGLRYIAISAAEQLREAEERERDARFCKRAADPISQRQFNPGNEHIFTQRNEGSSTSFYSCGICGASVQPMDRETHIEWHRRER